MGSLAVHGLSQGWARTAPLECGGVRADAAGRGQGKAWRGTARLNARRQFGLDRSANSSPYRLFSRKSACLNQLFLNNIAGFSINMEGRTPRVKLVLKLQEGSTTVQVRELMLRASASGCEKVRTSAL